MFDIKFGRQGYIPARFFEINPSVLNPIRYVRLYKDSRVHLHSKNGVYIVTSYSNHMADITCQRWKNEKLWGQRQEDHKIIHRSDIKCHYGGGLKNLNYGN